MPSHVSVCPDAGTVFPKKAGKRRFIRLKMEDSGYKL
jgi:hypothetical protein